MTRVSENSKNEILNYNLSRTKKKLEGLQIKGATLKKIARPSDDPAGNVDLLTLRSHLTDNKQFIRNLHYAKSYLELTENAISDLSNILSRAKEISIAHSSDTVNADVRKSAAEEVDQLLQQLRAIGNRTMGNRYLFGGYASHQEPFDNEGKYLGDNGRRFIEIRKDFFVPINLTGAEIFFPVDTIKAPKDDPLQGVSFTGPSPKNFQQEQVDNLEREIASQERDLEVVEDRDGQKNQDGLFDLLRTLKDALRNGDSAMIRNLLEGLDRAFSRLITLRTKMGAIYNSVAGAEVAIGDENIAHIDYRSRIEDADVNDLFSELEKQNNILKATYKSGASLVNKSLLDFLS